MTHEVNEKLTRVRTWMAENGFDCVLFSTNPRESLGHLQFQ